MWDWRDFWSLPECHTSASCESWLLSCHLANIPSSSSLHTYSPCSSLKSWDRSSQEHLRTQNGTLWHKTQEQIAVFEAVRPTLTDKEVGAAGAQTGAPLSCLNIRPISAWSWLVGDHRVWHLRHPELRVDFSCWKHQRVKQEKPRLTFLHWVQAWKQTITCVAHWHANWVFYSCG